MKKRIFSTVLILLVLSILLCACSTKATSDSAQAAVILYAVPTMGSVRMYDCLTDVIEQDSYGRILYCHSKLNPISNEEETVFVVYQKYDKEYVYYYEDICFLFGTGTADELSQLKLINDWNQLPDESKMSRRLAQIKPLAPVLIAEKSNIEDNQIMSFFEGQIDGGHRISDSWLEDISPNGQNAYVFVVEPETGSKLYYYVIAKSSSEIKSMEFKTLEDLIEKLPAFKKECNWKYGW